MGLRDMMTGAITDQFMLNQQPTERNKVTGAALSNTISTPSSPGGTTTVGEPLSGNTASPAGGGVETYPMGEKPGPGLQAGPVERAPFDPDPDRGPAGTVVRESVRKNANGTLAAAEQAASTARQTTDNADDNAEQMKALNKQLGVDRKSIEELEQEIYIGLKRAVEDKTMTPEQAKKNRKGWRRVFNQISEDEMGLFLIDFGLRAMMAGESMGDLGALGAAGAGAMGALHGRRREARADELALRGAARKGALDQYKAESGRMTAEAQKESAAAQTKRAEQAGFGYQGEKVWLENFFKKAGWTEQQIADYFAGAKGEMARRQDLVDALEKRISGSSKFDMEVDPITGKKYADFGPEDRMKWVETMLQAELESGGRQGALPGTTEPPEEEEVEEPTKGGQNYYDETG